ncbi:MAG: hypothetical protein KIT80_16895 [Chitinophagaceae bacterium]|nr:hypothetical protein [Chitinophagaceae bacterium]MCW5928598.1 hypothetical protein [Chitinophagaceae bacterium]
MNDWEIILREARRLNKAKIEFQSLGGRVSYKIAHVDETRIVIDRLNGGQQFVLGKRGAANAITLLIKHKRLDRARFYPSAVAGQTAMVKLHPNIHWDAHNQEYYWE